MKPWGHDREKVEELRNLLASSWQERTDKSIGDALGFDRVYVAKVRKRMGLSKTLGVLSDLRDMKRRNDTQQRSTSRIRAHRRMSFLEKQERKAQKRLREQEAQGVAPSVEDFARKYRG